MPASPWRDRIFVSGLESLDNVSKRLFAIADGYTTAPHNDNIRDHDYYRHIRILHDGIDVLHDTAFTTITDTSEYKIPVTLGYRLYRAIHSKFTSVANLPRDSQLAQYEYQPNEHMYNLREHPNIELLNECSEEFVRQRLDYWLACSSSRELVKQFLPVPCLFLRNCYGDSEVVEMIKTLCYPFNVTVILDHMTATNLGMEGEFCTGAVVTVESTRAPANLRHLAMADLISKYAYPDVIDSRIAHIPFHPSTVVATDDYDTPNFLKLMNGVYQAYRKCGSEDITLDDIVAGAMGHIYLRR